MKCIECEFCNPNGLYPTCNKNREIIRCANIEKEVDNFCPMGYGIFSPNRNENNKEEY